MPVFACRWSNGDVSFVAASNKAIAEERLDEVGDASGVTLRVVPEFMIHLTLSDAGLLKFQGFGEVSEQFVDFELYPALAAARMETLTEKGQPPTEAILAAVEVERTRVQDRPGPEPRTEAGKAIREKTGMPASMVNRIVERTAAHVLENGEFDTKKH